MVLQVASLLGAALILVAYVALQRRRWSSTGAAYLWFNLVGALLLAAVAIADRRAGFIVLEGVWAAVSLVSIVRRSPIAPDRTTP
jgi:drug/metabolite transporter (DMT)-like permease